MTLADNDNAALRSQVQHLHGVISLLRADNGHLRGRLAIVSERRWSRDPAEMAVRGCGCGEGPDGVHARWGPVMADLRRSTGGVVAPRCVTRTPGGPK